MNLPKILTKTTSLAVHYPQAHTYQDLQQAAFWTAEEVKLEKDIQPLLVETTESERHGILTVLKLFTLYETRADEFWGDVIKNMFPRPEIQELAALNSAVEISVHRRVYDKLNQLLNVSSDEFYDSYKDTESMKERMDFLDHYLTNGSDLEKIAAFCFAEGVVLFSSFAFLMSFRANGKNVLPNIGLAIKFSARDEDCVDDETQVLTDQGWMNIKDFDIDKHFVAQFDTNNCDISFTKASRKIEKDFNGEMISFTNGKGNFDQLVTPTHRYINRTTKCLKYDAKYAEDFNPHQYNFTPVSGYVDHPTNTYFGDKEALLLAIQADGHVSERYDGSRCGTIPVTFTLSKQRKIDRLLKLVELLNLNYKISDKKETSDTIKQRKVIRIDLPVNEYPVDNLKDFGWIEIDNVNLNWCSSFFDELVEWDGSKMESNKCSYVYYSSKVKENVDVVQALAVLCGKRVTISEQKDDRSENYSTIYRAYIHDGHERNNGSLNKNTVDYNGKVYCLTVPTGAFVIRRNDCVSITGNCHNQVSSWLFQTLKQEMNELMMDTDVEDSIRAMAEQVRLHEYEIIDEIFSKGRIDGITDVQMKHFVDSRINVVMRRMGYDKLYEVKYNPIADWFDKIVESYQFVDFFAAQGSSYSRGWDSQGFVWEGV